MLARLEEHPVPRPDHLGGATPPLGERDALGHENRLAVRVLVPRRTCSGREMNGAHAEARWPLWNGHWVDQH